MLNNIIRCTQKMLLDSPQDLSLLPRMEVAALPKCLPI